MEDIKEMSIQNVLELNEWYKKLGGKESCYLLDKKNFFTANRTKQNQEYEFVFRKRLYFYPFNTLGELTEYATKHKCYFEYRGSQLFQINNMNDYLNYYREKVNDPKKEKRVFTEEEVVKTAKKDCQTYFKEKCGMTLIDSTPHSLHFSIS